MTEIATIGHNLPPADQLEAKIKADYADQFKRMDELIEKIPTIPEQINDDETAEKVGDLLKAMNVSIKFADATRKIEYEPYKSTVDQINGIFNHPKEKLKTAYKDTNEKLTKYADAKAAKHKAELEEKQAREREEQARLEREAEEAEQKRLQAEEDKRKADAEAAEAQRQRDLAQQRAKEEKERAEQARRDRQRLETERKEREARETEQRLQREAEQEEERQKRAEEDAERQKKHDAEMARLKQVEEDAELKRRQERDEAQAALEKRREAEAQAREANKDVREAAKEEKVSMHGALRSERTADRLEAATQDDAGLSRTRSERGSLSSLTKRWEVHVTDYNKLPMAELWPHIARDALDAAVWKWMQTQPNTDEARKMPGARIERITSAQVR